MGAFDQTEGGVAREMPPWYIDRHVGINKFKDDPSLTDAEIGVITRWVDQGAPAGNAGRHAGAARSSATSTSGTSASRT